MGAKGVHGEGCRLWPVLSRASYFYFVQYRDNYSVALDMLDTAVARVRTNT